MRRITAPKLREGRPHPPRNAVRDLSTREVLLEAAARVLRTTSIAELTVDDVVNAAGVARGTFYLYFTDKYALVLELYNRLNEQMGARLAMPRESSCTLERISWPIREVIEFHREHIGIIMAVEQMGQRRPELATLRQDFRRAYTERFARELATSISHGRARAIDPHLAANALATMIGQVSIEWFGHGNPPTENATVDEVVHGMSLLLYRALFAREPAVSSATTGEDAA